MTFHVTSLTINIVKMIVHLLDLVKDVTAIYLVASVTFALNGQDDQKTEWHNADINFTDYHVQLLLVLTLSILVPLLLSAFLASRHHPGAALGMLIDDSKMSKSPLVLLKVSSWLLCILTQVVVLWRITRIQMEITRLKLGLQTDSSRTNITSILRLQQEEQNWRKILLVRKKIDVYVEISVQSIIDILMLLLIKGNSRSKQVFGLEKLFHESNWIFYFALFVMIRKMVSTNLDVIQEKKRFLGFKGKMILATHYLLSASIRVMSIVAFFAGPLGLFDILIGFKPDPPFAKPLPAAYILQDVSGIESLPLYGLAITDVTFFPLSYYYVAFILFVVGHSIVVFGLKQLFAPPFKRCMRLPEKIVNVIQNFSFVEELEDFDEDPKVRTKGELKKRFVETHDERGAIALIFLVENFVLCLPLCLTSHTMAHFYGEFAKTTTLSPEELQAYSNARLLIWLPFIIGIMSILTIPVSLAYYLLGHPWKVLANSLEEEDEDNIDYCHQLDEEDFYGDMASSVSDAEEGEHRDCIN